LVCRITSFVKRLYTESTNKSATIVPIVKHNALAYASKRRLSMKELVQRRDLRRAYGIREFAELFGISKDTAVRAANRGDLRTIYLGGRRLVPISEVDRVEREGLGSARRAR
jgi:excisionase family DNA binding protein